MVTRSDDRLRGGAGGGLGRSRPRLRRCVSTGASRVRRRHGTERSGATPRGDQDGCASQEAGTGAWLHCAGSRRGFANLVYFKASFQASRWTKVGVCLCQQGLAPTQTGQELQSRGKSTQQSWPRTPTPGAVPRRDQTPHPEQPARCGVDRPTPHPPSNKAIARPRIPSRLEKQRLIAQHAQTEPRTKNPAPVRRRGNAPHEPPQHHQQQDRFPSWQQTHTTPPERHVRGSPS